MLKVVEMKEVFEMEVAESWDREGILFAVSYGASNLIKRIVL